MYKVKDVSIKSSEFEEYLIHSTNKLYAILGVYEDCQKIDNYDNYYIYLNRISTEFNGLYELFGIKPFLSIVSIITGMYSKDNTTHKEVKSMAFHCISVIKRVKVIKD